MTVLGCGDKLGAVSIMLAPFHGSGLEAVLVVSGHSLAFDHITSPQRDLTNNRNAVLFCCSDLLLLRVLLLLLGAADHFPRRAAWPGGTPKIASRSVALYPFAQYAEFHRYGSLAAFGRA
jgi:hypothetical protein